MQISRLTSLFFFPIFGISLSGCGGSNSNSNKSAPVAPSQHKQVNSAEYRIISFEYEKYIPERLRMWKGDCDFGCYDEDSAPRITKQYHYISDELQSVTYREQDNLQTNTYTNISKGKWTIESENAFIIAPYLGHPIRGSDSLISQYEDYIKVDERQSQVDRPTDHEEPILTESQLFVAIIGLTEAADSEKTASILDDSLHSSTHDIRPIENDTDLAFENEKSCHRERKHHDGRLIRINAENCFDMVTTVFFDEFNYFPVTFLAEYNYFDDGQIKSIDISQSHYVFTEDQPTLMTHYNYEKFDGENLELTIERWNNHTNSYSLKRVYAKYEKAKCGPLISDRTNNMLEEYFPTCITVKQ